MSSCGVKKELICLVRKQTTYCVDVILILFGTNEFTFVTHIKKRVLDHGLEITSYTPPTIFKKCNNLLCIMSGHFFDITILVNTNNYEYSCCINCTVQLTDDDVYCGLVNYQLYHGLSLLVDLFK